MTDQDWKPTRETARQVAGELARLHVSSKTLFRGVVEFWPDHPEAIAEGWQALADTWAALEKLVPPIRRCECAACLATWRGEIMEIPLDVLEAG